MTFSSRTAYSFLFFCAATGTLLISTPAFATSEADPEPGPPLKAAAGSITAPQDVVTSANTVSYPPPVKPRFGVWPAVEQKAGALSGRIIYTSGGHGYVYVGSSWGTGRGTTYQINEDHGNVDQMTQFVYQAFSAGATVVPMRPVGNQVNEVVINNSDPQVTYTGTWTDSSTANKPYYGSASDSVAYRFAAASASETATARYTPNIPQPGYYPVYGWVLDSTNRCVDQLYRIQHTGGISEVRVNHRKVGKGWVYLGTYYFNQGTSGYCEISNQSGSPSGSNAIADAIRFGNGMGDIDRGGGISGVAREEEASRYWIQAMMGVGGDSSVYDRAGSNDSDDNVGAPLRMAAYMNREGVGTMTDRVYLSFHSNAGSGSARGAIGLYNDPVKYPGTDTPNQLELARMQGAEVNQDMRGVGSPPLEHAWSTRTGYTYSHSQYAFGEIRWDTVNHEMDATINEVAFHDNQLDADLLGDTKARVWIARAAVQGIIRYFNQFGGGPLVFAPDPPIGIKSEALANGTVKVSWTALPVSAVGGGTPSSYVVYRSTDGYGFGRPVEVTGSTSVVINDPELNQPVFFRVAARNSGGESLPSETAAVRTSGAGANNTLIVSGFDRQDRFLSPLETNPGLSAYRRIKPWISNNNSYTVQHAQALSAGNRGFDTAANETLNATLLSNYRNLVWICGQESTDNSTFSPTEQTLVTNFLSNGGNLFVSGAEIGWDLDHSGNGVSFFRNTLGAVYATDDAGTYNVSGGSGIFAPVGGFSFGNYPTKHETDFPPINGAPYDVAYPDTFTAANGQASIILNYSNGAGAAVRYVNGNARVITMGFPFECITTPAARTNLMNAVMTDFANNSGVSDWNLY